MQAGSWCAYCGRCGNGQGQAGSRHSAAWPEQQGQDEAAPSATWTEQQPSGAWTVAFPVGCAPIVLAPLCAAAGLSITIAAQPQSQLSAAKCPRAAADTSVAESVGVGTDGAIPERLRRAAIACGRAGRGSCPPSSHCASGVRSEQATDSAGQREFSAAGLLVTRTGSLVVGCETVTIAPSSDGNAAAEGTSFGVAQADGCFRGAASSGSPSDGSEGDAGRGRCDRADVGGTVTPQSLSPSSGSSHRWPAGGKRRHSWRRGRPQRPSRCSPRRSRKAEDSLEEARPLPETCEGLARAPFFDIAALDSDSASCHASKADLWPDTDDEDWVGDGYGSYGRPSVWPSIVNLMDVSCGGAGVGLVVDPSAASSASEACNGEVAAPSASGESYSGDAGRDCNEKAADAAACRSAELAEVSGCDADHGGQVAVPSADVGSAVDGLVAMPSADSQLASDDMFGVGLCGGQVALPSTASLASITMTSGDGGCGGQVAGPSAEMRIVQASSGFPEATVESASMSSLDTLDHAAVLSYLQEHFRGTTFLGVYLDATERGLEVTIYAKKARHWWRDNCGTIGDGIRTFFGCPASVDILPFLVEGMPSEHDCGNSEGVAATLKGARGVRVRHPMLETQCFDAPDGRVLG